MKIILSILLCLSLTSCTVYGVTNDYKKLSEEEKMKIVSLENFEKINTENIYKITSSQLKEELKKHPKSLVYIFTNGCSGPHCLPMSNYESFAKKNGYKLFLVMNGYGNLNETTDQRSQVFTEPLFAIDNDSYNSWYRSKYSRYFKNDLKGIETKSKTEWDGGLYFFSYGKFEKATLELPQ